ncbi:unnamed protein product, partial [Amoebophrya sp. A120]
SAIINTGAQRSEADSLEELLRQELADTREEAELERALRETQEVELGTSSTGVLTAGSKESEQENRTVPSLGNSEPSGSTRGKSKAYSAEDTGAISGTGNKEQF